MWVKGDTFGSGNIDVLFWIGENVNDKRIEIYASTTEINYNFRNNQYILDNSVGLLDGVWNHLTFTYNGTAGSAGREVYINGELKPGSHSVNANTLNLTSGKMFLGGNISAGNGYDFDGSISNFKLYDTVLTASEVKTLYDMGRLGNVIPKPLHVDTTLQVNGLFQGNSPLQFFVINGVHGASTSNQNVSLPPGLLGSKIVSITGMTFNTNGDGVPFTRHSEAAWEVDVYYSSHGSSPDNQLVLSGRTSAVDDLPWRIFVVTT